MAKQTVALLVILLLPMATARQENRDGHDVHTRMNQKFLSRFMGTKPRNVVQRYGCPLKTCEEFGECGPDCSGCIRPQSFPWAYCD
uniref:Ubs_14 putative toxin n=1 Tax=Unedogemmula bisaya TaxID=746885 RepID=A0A098LWJ4_UNEBI